MAFLAQWEQSALSQWIQESDYGFYLMLALHALGMAAMVGPILMLSARILGFADEMPYAAFVRLMAIAMCGFLVNLASGLALFGLHGVRLIATPVFLLKMALILAGGIATWRLARRVYAPSPIRTVRATRSLAVATIVTWLLVIFVGRLIGYTVYSTS